MSSVYDDPDFKRAKNYVGTLEEAADAIAAYLRGDNIDSSADKKIQAEVDREVDKLPQYPLNKESNRIEVPG